MQPNIRPSRPDLLIKFSELGQDLGRFAHIPWISETVDNSYEPASDTFVIQDGSIRLQAFMAKITPKH